MTMNMTTAIEVEHSTFQVIQGAAKPYMKRLLRWIFPEKRIANRFVEPPIIAYLGTVRGSAEFRIGDFSVSGFYMITEERWIAGTSFPVTLERVDTAGIGRILTVTATVVRTGKNGVGFSFVPPPSEDWIKTEDSGTTVVDMTRVADFLSGLPFAQPDEELMTV
ncbi:PilZ domain-containing protein [Occallatibacter savannae]|uniref:PilZ domain-containing protein n=1 Tax=Occallatibacter savannae TaxID=1002691 RepID=UPI0013A5654B|nr:PilZ domain-containing protein [Occallatibacter savannae]